MQEGEGPLPLRFLTMLKRHKERSKTKPIPLGCEHDDSKKMKHRVSCNPCLKQSITPISSKPEN